MSSGYAVYSTKGTVQYAPAAAIQLLLSIGVAQYRVQKVLYSSGFARITHLLDGTAR